MRTLLLATLALSLLGLGAGPGNSESKPAAPSAVRGPGLRGEDDKPVQGVRLAKAELAAVVHGNLAQATVTLTFANDQPRVLGGNLDFPLPQGATVTGYGLEINGNMVDGVAVEKEKARTIYESEIHKGVDPGLVEHVEGNAFRTRLYPIPANGSRSIKIEYLTQILQRKDGASLSLPLAMGDGLDELTIRIEAPEATAAPTIKAGGINGLNFAPAEHGFVAVSSASHARTGEELVVGLPELPAKSVAVEKRRRYARTMEELAGGKPVDTKPAFDHYFTATALPARAQRPAVQLQNHRVGVIWDASLSRGQGDHAHELKLLEATLNRLGITSADLIVLRNDVQWQAIFPVGDDTGRAKLIDAIKSLPYDGATALGSLTFPKNATAFGGQWKRTPGDYDLYLLFTDGFGNLGSDRPATAEVPVYAVCDALQANHELLQSLCRESGGAYFNLRTAADEQVLAGVGDAPLGLVSIECKPEEIAEVYPPIGSAVSGRLTVSGKLLARQATLKLNFGYGKEVTSSETFTISSDGAAEGSMIPRFWAQQKVAALAQFPDKNAEQIARLGRQFSLVTPNTSLLVLETVDQYVQYRVVPPPSRADIYKQFMEKIEQQHAELARTQEQKLQQVVAMWDSRVQWWDKEYKFPADLKVKESGDDAAPLPETAPPVRVAGGRAVRTHARPDSRSESPTPAEAPAPAPAADRPAPGLPTPDGVEQKNFPLLASKLNGADVLGGSTGTTVAIKPWDPKTPYLAALKAASPDKAYDVYLAQRKDYARSPAFYLDCADYFFRDDQPSTHSIGVRILSNVVELELHDARLLRVAAHRFDQVGEHELAIDLFEKVLKLRPEEPQSYRDLALALAARGDARTGTLGNPVLSRYPTPADLDHALDDYSRAMELLNQVVLGNWPRFPEIELPVLMEANDIASRGQRILAFARPQPAVSPSNQPGKHEFHNPLDSRLQKNLDLDVRVVMTWDADQTDLDLWVTEPSGDKCFYGHNRTTIGGLLSHDFTDGYGPEEYCLRKLMPGQYKIQANFYGSRQQELTGPASVQATIITNFGRPTESRQAITIRLKDVKDVVDIGTVTLGAPVGKPVQSEILNK